MLLPFDQAYKFSIKKTDALAKSLHEQFKKEERNYAIVCPPPLGLPLKPLAGIRAPAIVLELGLKKKDDWKKITPLLVLALNSLTQTNVASHGTSA